MARRVRERRPEHVPQRVLHLLHLVQGGREERHHVLEGAERVGEEGHAFEDVVCIVGVLGDGVGLAHTSTVATVMRDVSKVARWRRRTARLTA